MRNKILRRFRGILAYDGTRYAGFQRQTRSTLTIQSQVEAAIATVTGQAATVIGAGRTDAGVHATGQVIAFDCEWRHTIAALWRAINVNLPFDIVMVELSEAQADFHPRYDALSREYVYHFYVADVRNPLRDRYSWYIGTSVDIGTFQAAASLLVGTHDFATFGKPPTGEVTVRQVFQSICREVTEQAGMYTYTIEANAFLKHMVRSIMGTLIEVGRGKTSITDFRKAFAAQDRRYAGTTAPPHGLTLKKVTYREDSGNNNRTDRTDNTGIRQDESKNLDT